MISTNEKIAKKQRKILGPLGRLLLKVFRWEINGKIPDLEKMILIGIPHTAMRDAWYALLAVWALDLKVNFFGAAWVFTRLPSLFTKALLNCLDVRSVEGSDAVFEASLSQLSFVNI